MTQDSCIVLAIVRWMLPNWIVLWYSETEMSWMALSEFTNIYTVTVVMLLALLLLTMMMTFSVWRHHCFHFPQWKCGINVYGDCCYNLYFCLSSNFMISNCCHCDEFTTTNSLLKGSSGSRCVCVCVLVSKYVYVTRLYLWMCNDGCMLMMGGWGSNGYDTFITNNWIKVLISPYIDFI